MHPSTAVQKIKLNIWFKNLDYVLILALKPIRKYVISLMTDATNDFFFFLFFLQTLSICERMADILLPDLQNKMSI